MDAHGWTEEQSGHQAGQQPEQLGGLRAGDPQLGYLIERCAATCKLATCKCSRRVHTN